jgi:hypothetical protein
MSNTNISTIIDTLSRLSREATPGPVEKWLDDNGHWHLRFPSVLRGFHGGKYGYITYAAENDVDLDIALRNSLDTLIQCLREAVEVTGELNDILSDSDARKQIDSFTGQPLREFRRRWGMDE